MSRETVLPETGYYNEWTAAYYDPQEETQNHEILILGWDDSFSRFLFAQTPDQDGAFICQNSWGEDFGDQGIFYVSYADANIARTAMAYTKIEPTDNYDRIYQTDGCGGDARGTTTESAGLQMFIAQAKENSSRRPDFMRSEKILSMNCIWWRHFLERLIFRSGGF